MAARLANVSWALGVHGGGEGGAAALGAPAGAGAGTVLPAPRESAGPAGSALSPPAPARRLRPEPRVPGAPRLAKPAPGRALARRTAPRPQPRPRASRRREDTASRSRRECTRARPRPGAGQPWPRAARASASWASWRSWAPAAGRRPRGCGSSTWRPRAWTGATGPRPPGPGEARAGCGEGRRSRAGTCLPQLHRLKKKKKQQPKTKQKSPTTYCSFLTKIAILLLTVEWPGGSARSSARGWKGWLMGVCCWGRGLHLRVGSEAPGTTASRAHPLQSPFPGLYGPPGRSSHRVPRSLRQLETRAPSAVEVGCSVALAEQPWFPILGLSSAYRATDMPSFWFFTFSSTSWDSSLLSRS